MLGAGLHGNSSELLNQPTRIDIYNYVLANPGVHFRGVCNGLGLSVGVVQYHLDVLEKSGLLISVIDGNNQRYFEANAFTKADMELVSMSRHQTANKILTILTQNGSTLHRDLATSLGITSQALSWQMNKLEKADLVNAEKTGINVRYSLNCEKADALRFALTVVNASKAK
ncbi:MAG: winged helix-turn-helix transcriptional regulator [Candidatus Bathyarchaeota archaeon]|nr:winged helix-turn-helix transcriptional regulator [Candidatus Bathyarchaeota archaeon]